MNFESVLYINVPIGKVAGCYSIRARGRFIREPKVGINLTFAGLPCDTSCKGLSVEIDMVDEVLSQDFLFVRFKDIDLLTFGSEVSPEDLATQISDYLTEAGWRTCNDDGD